MALGYRHYQIRLWKMRALLLVILALCVVVAWSVVARLQVEREMAARREAVQTEYQRLVERYNALNTEVDYLKDERSLESEIRKHFDVAREGESVVILLDESTPATSSVRQATSTVTATPWWQFWR